MPSRKSATALTAKEARFVEQYLIHLNGTRAAIEAGYALRSAREQGYQLMQRPGVKGAIDAAIKRRSKRVKIQQDDVLRLLYGVLKADPSAISQLRRHCCRYCWGAGHRYQRTTGEMERDRAAHELLASTKRGKPPVPPFDGQGGTGYDKRSMPSPKCPECFGEGVAEVWMADTRDLTPEQLALYAGTQQTREGVKTLTHDVVAVASLAMRHLGMLQDKVDHTNKGAAFDNSPAVLNVTIGGK